MTSSTPIRSLAAAAAWCSAKGATRDTSIRPACLLVDSRADGTIFVADPETARRSVDELVHARALALGDLPSVPLDGRILAFRYQETLSDGGAEDMSGGFFDADNQPPGDTWICIEAPDTLLCWVPRGHVAVVQAGIDANPERSLFWWPDEGPMNGP